LAKAYDIGARVERQALVPSGDRSEPSLRPLRIYTFDASLSARLGGVATVLVPYEKLALGPVGNLFEVKCDPPPDPLKAKALDLDDPHLLLSAGLTPTPADARFHSQMVYAVCSLTYAVFKRALGRDIAWATEPSADGANRLVLRPFGFRGRNAGYSREAGAITFGYFNAGADPAGFTVQKGLICTALSHDIIAHETTHALLDGLRASFDLPTNPDVLAFHEAFADLVALFLHFSYPEVVEQAIRETGGAAARGSVLVELAREFGYARSRTRRARSLRSGIDVEDMAAFDSDAATPDVAGPRRYDPGLEHHALGSVLVSAVFEAFTTIVKRKTERFYAIAGVSPQQPPTNDALIRAIAGEASDVAGRFLDICIRAIDYCPPSDMEFGEYLRALVTADAEMEQRDKWGFREALMRSFRRRHIFPHHVKFMSEDAVRWEPADARLRIPGLAFARLRFRGEPGEPASRSELKRQADALGRFVTDRRHAAAFRLIPPGAPKPKGVEQAYTPIVQSVRVARRACPDGRILFDLVAEITQSCTVRLGKDLMDMNGGCTVVLDPQGRVRYAIFKRFGSERRVERQRAAIRGRLKAFWEKKGRRYVPRPDALRRLHGLK